MPTIWHVLATFQLSVASFFNYSPYIRMNIKAVNSVNFILTPFGGKIDNVSKTSKVSDNKSGAKPKFLYHLTSEDNYNSMLKDGFIKKSQWYPHGVFLIDMDNFKTSHDDEAVKRFLYAAAHAYSENGKIKKEEDFQKVVILEVPVEKMQKDLFSVRFHDMEGGISAFYLPWHNLSEINEEEYKKLAEQTMEFIYQDSIPVGKIKKFAQIDVTQIDSDNFKEDFFRKIEK